MREYDWVIAVAFGLGLAVLLVTPAMRWTEISAGDWLTFAGALMGVGGAVFGAITVEKHKARLEQQRGMQRLADAVGHVRLARQFVPQPNGAAPFDPAHALYMRYLRLQQVEEALSYATERVTIDDMDLWSWLAVLRGHLTGRLEAIAPVLEPLLLKSVPPDKIAQLDAELTLYLQNFDMPLAELTSRLEKEGS